ncbi:amino acid ABC transporter substrate-binding protein [Photorhabdus noenieputensis]|uniref:amino acid ABC transporter substrate-binding protein n=1 Tax=Photorhabdus noenieputensis TaxID=1208607 RepID=UPI001BD4D824|nr:amino acid ABC transporter substrate-binding protein [Photorhabdus noenieputensis]MBS9436227.1 amino acid ABC transporter substrate-binding protein [Photorhabdus noenieputensis]MCK3669099.1 amino acid ABC transporter substrate-binding protein [Photorhabdus noenieputensis]
MKTILTLLLASTIQFGLVHSANAESTLDKIKSTGTFKIATEGAYPPFTYHDASGTLTGFDVDIGREIARRLNVKPTFIEGKWDGLIAGLDAGRSDAVINQIAITPERKKKYDFSIPYITSQAVLIINKDNNNIRTFSDLQGKTSAHTLTNNFAQIARDNGAEIIGTNGFSQEIELVSTGRADATINDNLSYLDYKKHKPNAPVKIVATSPNAGQTAVLLRQGESELKVAIDKAITDIKADGTYQKIWSHYFGDNPSE